MHETHADTALADYERRWCAAMAPRTGDVRHELTLEAAEYLGLSFEDVARRVEHSVDEFTEEWNRRVSDSTDEQQVTRFYNESQAELFEQIAWHASDAIHHRSLVCADLASARPGRDFLDYGSGIGSNAIVFGLAGFNVTLADIADPLLGFAKWRCQRRGLQVRTIDLKRQSLDVDRYEVITCFDVLEHVPKPVMAVKRMREALRPGGLFFVYAPFGYDPIRPMHIVHDQRLFRRLRSLGFRLRGDLQQAFPPHVRAPYTYECVRRSPLGKLAYYVRDNWMTGRIGASIARTRRLVLNGREKQLA